MKRFFLFAILLLLVTGCERAPQNPLLGRWKSDEQATLIEARDKGGLTQQQLQLLESEKVFGKLVATIDSEEIVFEYDGKRDPSPYSVLNIEEPFVDIELFNTSTSKYETIQIETQGDRMLVPSSLASFREVFVKID